MPFKDMWDFSLRFAGIALGLATVLSALVYMLSELLQNDKMKGWAKLELTEVFYSAIIISMVVTGLPIIDSAVQGAIQGVGGASATTAYISVVDAGESTSTTLGNVLPPEPMDICGGPIAANEHSIYYGVESCHMRLGIWYMREIFDEAKNFAFDIYLSYIGSSMMSEFTINIEFLFEKAGFLTFNPWRGFYTMGNKVKELVFDWAIKLMMLTKFQEVLLKFIATALFPALFVLGAILRTFSFTRRLGGLLLGIAIALYFIFPAFYAFGALVMLDIKNDKTVLDNWYASPANPGNDVTMPQLTPEMFPDPPIANTMYMRGTIHMPGGGSQGYTDSAVKERLRYYEGNPDSFQKYMDEGKDDAGGGMLPMSDPDTGKIVDLTSTATHSDEDKDDAIANARAQTDTWFGSVSKENKFDVFMPTVWKPNGPLDTLGRLTFWSVFFALFSLLGTIAAIRSLSITFGGDIEIAGLTRLI